MDRIIIRQGSIKEVVELSREVTEFFQPYSEQDYKDRLADTPHIILVAEFESRPAGFKVGYQRWEKDTFYSWMGGVLPAFRRRGIASRLAEEQEKWAKNRGYTKIIFKTRNRLTNMIHFGINRDFLIVDLIKTGEPEEYRIVMEKYL